MNNIISNKLWDECMAEELENVSAELPAADISADISVNNDQDDAEPSDAGEDPDDSASIYISKGEV